MMRMGVGALAFAALEAFGQEAIEYAQDEEVKVGTVFSYNRITDDPIRICINTLFQT